MSGGTGRRRSGDDIKLTGLIWLSSIGRVLGHRDHAAGRIERNQGPPGGGVNMHPRRRWQLRLEVGASPIEPAILSRALVSRHVRGCSGGRARRRSHGWWQAASGVVAGR